MSALTQSRRAGIVFGGTDFAVLLNMRPYGKGLSDLYLEKIDEAKPKKPTDRMQLGTDFEEPIAQLWAKKNGVKIRRVNQALVHPKWTWIRGHIDRAITGRPRDGLEVKLAADSDDWGDQRTDEVPEIIIPQVQTYMLLKNAPQWQIAALLCGEFGADLSEYTVKRDEKFLDMMVEAGEGFIENHLLPRIPPDPVTDEEAKRLFYAVEKGKKVYMTATAMQAVVDHVDATAEKKVASEKLKNARLVLRRHMEDADQCMMDQDSKKALLSNKEQTQWRFDETAFREDHPNTYKAYKRELTFRKLIVLKEGKALVSRAKAVIKTAVETAEETNYDDSNPDA